MPWRAATPGAGDDGGRRSQTEGTGAGDHEDGHGVEGGRGEWGSGEGPAETGGEGDGDHDGDEDGADTIDEALDGRLGGAGALDEADELGETALGAGGRGFDDEEAVMVEGAPGDLVAGLLGNGTGFAGQQAFVGAGETVADEAVGGKALAGTDGDEVAGTQVGGQDVALMNADAQTGAFGTERGKIAQGLDGAATGMGLEPLADRDERDDEGTGGKVDRLGMGGGDGPEGEPKLAVVPSATSVSMLPAPWRRAEKAPR